MSRTTARVSVALASASLLLMGCNEGIGDDDLVGDDGVGEFDEDATGEEGPGGDGDGSGDGDGDPSTGDGDGDGDGDPSTGDGDGDGDGDEDPSTGDGDGDGDPDVPQNAYCSPVANWNPQWNAWALEVIELVNQARAQGGNCGTKGNFSSSAPLAIDPALTCAARVHSKDMADNNYFSHTNLQGQEPGYRIGQAGYEGSAWGENIGAGYGSAEQAVAGWLASDGHCANILNPGFKDIGIGYAHGPNSDYKHYWTQVFGGG